MQLMARRTICVMGRPIDQDDGIGVYTLQLLRHLLALDADTRYTILLRTAKHADAFQEFPNADVRVVPAKAKIWWDQVKVAHIARQVGADLIFNPKFSLPLLSGRPGVFVLHGSDWFINPGNYAWWDNLYIRIMLPLSCWKAKRLLAISRIALRDTVRYAHIDASKVTLSYAAPGPQFTPAADRAALDDFAARYHLPPRFILTVARTYHTGHGRMPEYPGGNNERLIAGYQRYRAGGGRLPLVVVGRDIDRYLHEHGIDARSLDGVLFTGFIPNHEIVHAYQLAELFVLATLYESFALPLVEAMASGCPAVVPTTGACRDIAGPAARYLDPLSVDSIAAAIRDVAADQALRDGMRAAGLERVSQFTWRKTAERTLAAIDSAIAARPVSMFNTIWPRMHRA
jgi:glycosyltransferase involved in cell wall biosynthesis